MSNSSIYWMYLQRVRLQCFLFHNLLSKLNTIPKACSMQSSTSYNMILKGHIVWVILLLNKPCPPSTLQTSPFMYLQLIYLSRWQVAVSYWLTGDAASSYHADDLLLGLPLTGLHHSPHADQPIELQGTPPSSTRFPEAARKLNEAERQFLSPQHNADF